MGGRRKQKKGLAGAVGQYFVSLNCSLKYGQVFVRCQDDSVSICSLHSQHLHIESVCLWSLF